MNRYTIYIRRKRGEKIKRQKEKEKCMSYGIQNGGKEKLKGCQVLQSASPLRYVKLRNTVDIGRKLGLVSGLVTALKMHGFYTSQEPTNRNTETCTPSVL